MTATPRLRALSVKFALVLFAVVAGALALVYLAVVPRLESRLVDAKVAELERGAAPIVADLRRYDNPFLYAERVSLYAASVGARVVIFRRLSEDSLVPVADSSGLSSGDVQRDRVAVEAATSGAPASGRVERQGRAYAEVAVPVRDGTVVLISASLADALANVRLVRKSLLAAGLGALALSGLVGYVAAWGVTRRLRRLESAAGRIARGDFEAPVVDPGRDEIGELARALDAMRARLAHLDRARREFIANASHELRTPLFSLGGFLELLADEELDEETRRDFLAEMRAQVERLGRLATDLLDLSRMDAGHLRVESGDVDLARVARTVADEFRAVADAGRHELQVAAPVPVAVVGDEQRILQIARILVENALRHTPEGTPVELVVASSDGAASLAVRDEGPGIALAEQEHVFERFYRADGGHASGSGLGLAIARELATIMGGSLDLRSHPGETVFTLTLGVSDWDISHGNAELAGPRAPAAA